MMVLSVGFPGLFMDWGEGAIASLLAGASGTPKLVAANALDDIAEAVIASDSDDFVFGIRQPSVRLRQALLASSRSMVVFLDDPIRGALHLIAHRGHSVADAVRNVSGSCVKLMDFGRLESALVLRAGRDGADLTRMIRELAAYLSVSITDVEVAEVVARQAPAELEAYLRPFRGAGAGEHYLRATFDALSEHDRAILDETLGVYAKAFEGQGFGKLIWPRDMFWVADSPGEPATRDIDIAGKARCLIFGPYMQLAAGNWQARVVLGFSVETLGVNFTVDVATPDRIAHTNFTPDAAGVYEVIVDFTIEDPNVPLEVRVWSERAAFDGHIALGFVALTPGPVPVPRATSVEAYLGGRLSV